jgi:uracil-DNA glycosylase
MFFEQMHASWQEALRSSKPLLDELEAKLQASGDAIAPPMNLVMRAFSSPLENVRVLIVGQDPYPTPGHAVGLSFAVAPDVSPLPRSLANIVRELSDDLGKFNTDGSARKGDLSKWADQGVLLLNRHLTTNLSETAGHLDLGWARFTDQVVAVLNRKLGRRLVSVLWGAQAQQLSAALCDSQVIASAHPSPLSARKGFFGSRPFSGANTLLQQVGEQPIDWSC